MWMTQRDRSAARPWQRLTLTMAVVVSLHTGVAFAQGLMGTLIGTVKDEQGGVLAGAQVSMSSPALIGRTVTVLTSEKGQLRFPSLPPGLYVMVVDMPGFMSYREEQLTIGAGATIERTPTLKVAGFAESTVVEGAGSRIEARHPGFSTRFGYEDIRTIPTRRASMFDFIRAAPGITPTSPGSGTTTTISAFRNQIGRAQSELQSR